MNFFKTPDALKQWVEAQGSGDRAAKLLMEVTNNQDEQDIVETCRNIFDETEDGNASEVLFKILAKHNLTQVREGNMSKDKLKKEAQIMRQPGQYSSMPLRICPKLPYSVGKRLISTYNCRHYCLDSIVFDDDPLRVYCAETLWRRHVADKFSREFKDKDGNWVGGYINNRFQVFHYDGGNKMQLAHGERTRQPRPHEYSIEKRMSEGRGEEVTNITASELEGKKMVKLASAESHKDTDDDRIFRMFSDIVDMREAGLTDEDIIYQVAEHYDESISSVAKVHRLALKKFATSGNTIYACSNKMVKTADKIEKKSFAQGTTVVCTRSTPVIRVQDGASVTLLEKTPCVVEKEEVDGIVMQIVGGQGTGQVFKISNVELDTAFDLLEDIESRIQDGADELGLNESFGMEISENTEKVGPREEDTFPVQDAEESV